MRNNDRVRWVLVISLAGVLQGCAATALNPAAARVIVSKNPHPKSCKFLGTLVGNQGGSFLGGITSNRNLAQGSMNDIKNQALGLGANYVELETDRAGSTSSRRSGGQTDVTLTGNAYNCPPAEIGLD